MSELRGTLELREDESRATQGRLVIRLQPWRALANDRAEIFEAGSLEWRGLVPLDVDHDGEARALLDAEDNGERVVLSGAIPDTARGRALRAELAERPEASVQFKASAEHRERGVRVIDKARLEAVSAVRAGAYKTATVEVRARGVQGLVEAAYRWL